MNEATQGLNCFACTVKRPLSKRQKISFQDQLSLNVGQKYCRMLPFAECSKGSNIELPFVIKIFVLTIFEWPFYTGFTVNEFFCLKQLLHIPVSLCRYQLYICGA